MSPELQLSVLVAPSAAFVGAQGAVALTNRHTRKLENERHARECRALAREVASDLILAAGEASAALKGVGIFTKSSLEGLQNLMSVLKTSSRLIARATLQIRLTFADRDLSDMALSLARDTDAFALEFTPHFPQLLGDHAVDPQREAGFIKRAEAVNLRFSRLRRRTHNAISRAAGTYPIGRTMTNIQPTPAEALKWVHELEGEAAAGIADVAGYRDDFERAEDACRRILALASVAPIDEKLIAHLWTSAVVDYVRPFQSDRRQELPAAFIDAVSAEGQRTHDDIKAVRNKYVAHSENSMETNIPIYELTDPASGERKVLRVGTLSMRRIFTPLDAVRLLKLIGERKHALEALTREFHAHVMKQIDSMDIDELYAEPSVPAMRIERGQSPTSKRPARREPSTPITLQ